MTLQYLFTCEHARNVIPARYRDVADRAGRILATHRGYDPGTLELGRQFSRHFRAPLHTARYSRLLIELNRSRGHPALWSEFSRPLEDKAKRELLEKYYHPYRESVARSIRGLLKGGGAVLHVGVHSFTPVWHGEARNADIGLLYDPARALETNLCAEWKRAMHHLAPDLRVRMNYPYRGVADGLITQLRKHFSAARYAGVELEVNQALVRGTDSSWRRIRRLLVASLSSV